MCRTWSAGRSRTGRVIIPAWQKRQPRVQPRKTSTLSRSCTTSVSGTSWSFGYGHSRQVGDRALLDSGGHARVARRDRGDPAVVEVADVVQRRHVHAGDVGEVAAAPADDRGRPARFHVPTTSVISQTTSSPSPSTTKSRKSASGSGLYVQCPPAPTRGARAGGRPPAPGRRRGRCS